MNLPRIHTLRPDDERGEPLDYSEPVRRTAYDRALAAERKLARQEATIARLSERVELPLCAADLAVQARIPLTHARRVWRVLTEKA